MKTKIKSLILGIGMVAVTLVTGCASFATLNDNTPHTTIKGTIAGQPFSIENPKDTILAGLSVTASTNGTASINIASLTTVMNPVNTQSTGEAMANNTKEIFNGIHTVTQDLKDLAASAATKAGGL